MLSSLKTRLLNAMISTTGYKVVRARPSERFRGNAEDSAEVGPFLDEIVPVVRHNAVTKQYPDPTFLKKYFTPKRLGMSRELLKQCEKVGIGMDGRTILDVGCHAGYLLRLLARRYPTARLFGCDVYQDKVEMAKRACPEAEVFQSQVADLPVDGGYDVVFFNEVLEHTRDPEAVLRHLMTLKTPDGWLVVTVPDGREDTFPAMSFHEEFDAFGGHVNFWSPESWKLFLERVGDGAEVVTAKLPYGCLFAALR